jgi:5-methylcytosine-specific restriction endonuclease McrA
MNPNFLKYIRREEVRLVDKDTYKKIIRRHRRNGVASLACSVCAEADPTVLEEHHIFGKNNSEEKIPLCKNCHPKVTDEQNKISPKSRSSSSPSEKTGFILISIGALLKIISKTLIDLGHEVIDLE